MTTWKFSLELLWSSEENGCKKLKKRKKQHQSITWQNLSRIAQFQPVFVPPTKTEHPTLIFLHWPFFATCQNRKFVLFSSFRRSLMGEVQCCPPPLKSVSLILKNVQVINMKWLTDVNASEEIPAPVKEKKEKETRKRSILQYRRSALAVAPLALQVGVVLGQSSHGWLCGALLHPPHWWSLEWHVQHRRWNTMTMGIKIWTWHLNIQKGGFNTRKSHKNIAKEITITQYHWKKHKIPQNTHP